MSSEPIRDAVTDHLLTPQNAALVVIDYQASQIGAVGSIDRDLLVDNIVSVARVAETFHLPVVLSTVNVANGHGPTVPELKAVLIVQAGATPISWISLACELQRDWARVGTVPDVVDIVLTTRLVKSA